MLQAPDPDAHYGVRVSLVELAAHNYGAAEVLLRAPRQVLPLLDAALQLGQEQLRAQQPGAAQQALVVKDAVHARLHGLALHHDSLAREVCPGTGAVGAPHIDRLLTVAGTVTKTGPVKMLEARRLYECGRCKHR